MKRALLALLLLAVPASAADQWRKLHDGIATLTDDRPMFSRDLDRGELWVAHQGDASATNALHRIRRGVVSAFDGPAPATAAYGQTWGMGFSVSQNRVNFSGGGAGGRWMYHTPSKPPPGTWTSRVDTTGASILFGRLGVWGHSTGIAAVDETLATPVGQTELTGCVVNPSFEISYLRRVTGGIFAQGVDATPSELFGPPGSNFTGPPITEVRPCFPYQDDIGIMVGYTSATGDTVIFAMDAAGNKDIDAQVILTQDLRPGTSTDLFDATARAVIWSTAGAAYSSTGGAFAAFATGDLTMDGGDTLRGCTGGPDWDGLSRNLPTCLTSGGDVWYFGEVIPAKKPAGQPPAPFGSGGGLFP